MTPNKYELTDEHKAALPAHHAKWLAIALSTAPMTVVERRQIRAACVGLYASADLGPPKVVFVPCPLRAAIVAGLTMAAINNSLILPPCSFSGATPRSIM